MAFSAHLRRWPVAAVVACAAAAAFAIGAGCSSSDQGTPSASDAGDAATAPEAAAPLEAGLVDAAACAPGPLDSTPEWHPPRPMGQDACSDPQQVEGFVNACIFTAQSSAVCAAFAQQNPDCYACIASSPIDATWGPLIDYSNPAILELNVAGCYAIGLGEGTDGCGAAAGLVDDCTRLACLSCNADTEADFAALESCQESDVVQDECATYVASYDTKCSVLTSDAAAPNRANALCDTTGLSFEDALRKYIRLWCTGPGDAGVDGGGDAGDGGDGGG